jgi:Cys-rich repeat protein
MRYLPVTQGVSENPGIGKKILGGTLVALGLGGLLWFLIRKADVDHGGTCVSDSDCPSGMVCQNGTCVSTGGDDTPKMKFCDYENKSILESDWTWDRCTKKWCVAESKYLRASDYTNSRCRRACTADSMCPPGTVCRQGTCIPV